MSFVTKDGVPARLLLPESAMLRARRFRVLLLLAGLLLPGLLPAPALAGGPDAAGGVLLRYVFRVGEVRRYEAAVQMEMQVPNAPAPLRADIEMRAVLRVERVLSDGSAMVATEIERMEMFVMGDRAPLPDVAGLITRQRLYPDGRVTETQIDTASLERLGIPPGVGQQLPFGGGQGVFTQNLAGTSTQLPERPMRVGEFVDRDQSVDLSALALPGAPVGGPMASAPLTARSRLTLEELSVLGGRRVARLSETISASLPSLTQEDVNVAMTMSGRVTNVLDLATAWPVTGEGTLDAAYTITAPGRDGRPETVQIPIAMRLSYRQV